MLQLFEDEELADVLADSFRKRAAEVADHAHNPRGALGEGADFLRGLDEMERQGMYSILLDLPHLLRLCEKS